MENKETELKMNDLFEVGSLVDTVKIGKHAFTLKTLTFGEATGLSDNMVDILATVIKSIDNVEYSLEDKKNILNRMQTPYVTLIMRAYETLNKKQQGLLDDVKKN